MLRHVEGILTPTRGVARLAEALMLIQRLATKPAPSLKTSQLWGSSFWPRREISATRTMGSRKRLRESRSLPARGAPKKRKPEDPKDFLDPDETYKRNGTARFGGRKKA